MSTPDLDHARSPEHLSRRAREALAFDPPSTVRTPEAVHAESCATCRSSVEELRRERDAFLALRRPAAFADAVIARAERPRWRGWPALGAAVAISFAALGAFFVVTPRDAGEVHLKGATALRLALYLSRDGAPARPFDGRTTLTRGDVLKFGVDAPREGFILIVDADARGQITPYYPTGADESAPVAEGRDTVLPGSIELDDAPGEERIFAFFSSKPLTLARVEAALQVAFVRAGRSVAAIDLAALDLDAEVTAVSITKEAR